MADALWHVSNNTLHRAFKMPYVSEVTQERPGRGQSKVEDGWTQYRWVDTTTSRYCKNALTK